MPVLNVKQLHNETSAILNEVCKGKSFDVEKHGKVIATIRPAKGSKQTTWAEIMAPVWALQKKAKGKTPNPVLAERVRRRR
jgi:antitoxin (DNA-binding transcriptional repressor) of toxin-antitoxin stability system